MKSCGKSFAQSKSQKITIFFNIPSPLEDLWPLSPRKGFDNFLRLSEWTVMLQSLSSSPFPAQTSNTVFTEGIHQAPVPLHRMCHLPGTLKPDLHSTTACQIPTLFFRPNSFLLCFLMPPSRISCFLSLGRKGTDG